jgi:GTP pyrophosphokinase
MTLKEEPKKMVSIRGQSLTPGEFDELQWLDQLIKSYSAADAALITKAFQLAKKANETLPPVVKNITVLQQSIAMVEVLIDLGLDVNSLAAALVILPVRQQAVTMAQVSNQLGAQVTKLVESVETMIAIDALHQMGHKTAELRDDKQHEAGQMDKLRKMLLAMVEDPRGILIKLAEHLCLLRIAKHLPAEQSRIIAEKTADIYAPLANRLGIGQIKWEMEDLAFRYREPNTYKQIAKLLDEKRIDREDYIQRVITQLKDELAHDGINADVQGRVKHIYSIWRKMQRKHLDYDEIYDIRAVRVLVDKLQDCYAALGTVHRLWQHIPKEFDDYIATPKDNGYKSLHTAVVGPAGQVVEVQIRTHQMHQESELGVASHWRYKEGVQHDARYEDKIAWLRQLIAWQEQVADADELVNELREKVYEDRVYVLTPKGEVVDLQRGATPLDFAYHVHTTVGHRCRGAKVNGRIVPLTYQLSTGEQIEILTGGEPNPSRDWLNPDLGYIVTSRARAKIRGWFHEQNRDQNLAAGKALMEKELNRLGVETLDYKQLAAHFNFQDGDEILVALGRGDMRPIHVINVAREEKLLPKLASIEIPPAHHGIPTTAHTSSRTDSIAVLGVDNLLTHMAGCCHPIPGDKIVGYVTLGQGVSIHREDCANILHVQATRPERLVDVTWGTASEQKYPVSIRVVAHDRPALLRDITQVFVNERSNILSLNSQVKENIMYITLTVEVAGLERLGKALERLQLLPNVIEVQRQQQ